MSKNHGPGYYNRQITKISQKHTNKKKVSQHAVAPGNMKENEMGGEKVNKGSKKRRREKELLVCYQGGHEKSNLLYIGNVRQELYSA